jgi:hypothetical protein
MESDAKEHRATGPRQIEFFVDADEAIELIALLGTAIADLSPEIADADSARYRTILRGGRDRLRAGRGRLVELSGQGA